MYTLEFLVLGFFDAGEKKTTSCIARHEGDPTLFFFLPEPESRQGPFSASNTVFFTPLSALMRFALCF
jgi:hypothetical protein